MVVGVLSLPSCTLQLLRMWLVGCCCVMLVAVVFVLLVLPSFELRNCAVCATSDHFHAARRCVPLASSRQHQLFATKATQEQEQFFQLFFLIVNTNACTPTTNNIGRQPVTRRHYGLAPQHMQLTATMVLCAAV